MMSKIIKKFVKSSQTPLIIIAPLTYAHSKTCPRKNDCHCWKILKLQIIFITCSQIQYIWDHLKLTECIKSTNFKNYCFLNLRCYITAKQYVIIRLGSMCLVFRKFELYHAPKCYAYKNHVLEY